MGFVQDTAERVQHVSTETVGKVALAASGTGFTLQWLTDFGSVVAIWVNVLLGIGGLYLLMLKIMVARREARKSDGTP